MLTFLLVLFFSVKLTPCASGSATKSVDARDNFLQGVLDFLQCLPKILQGVLIFAHCSRGRENSLKSHPASPAEE